MLQRRDILRSLKIQKKRSLGCHIDEKLKHAVVCYNYNSNVNAVYFCSGERKVLLMSEKQILEGPLTNHLGSSFTECSLRQYSPGNIALILVFHLNMLFSTSLLPCLLMWSHPLALQCTALQHEKAVSSSSLGRPECNANIRTHLWPHNKHSHHYVAPEVFPEGKLCWRCECSWIVSYSMSQLNIIDGVLMPQLIAQLE